MGRIDTATLSVSAAGTLPRVPFLQLKELVLGKAYELSIVFVPPKRAQELNIAHRGKDYVPDTLAFPYDKKSGEIVMCRSAMRGKHIDHGMDARTYLVFLLIHSMLHLKGYQHGGTMEREETRLLKRFTTLDAKTTHNRRN